MSERDKKAGSWIRGYKRILPLIREAHAAKTHTDSEMRKISSAKRCKKWREINIRAIKEYHAWVEKELIRLGWKHE